MKHQRYNTSFTNLWNQKLQPDSHKIAWSLSWTSLWHTPQGYIGGALGFWILKTFDLSVGYTYSIEKYTQDVSYYTLVMGHNNC